MLLLKLGLELLNLVKKFQSLLKIWTECRLNFNEVECTTPPRQPPPPLTFPCNKFGKRKVQNLQTRIHF